MIRSTGRPRVTPVQLKDGYYIEVCDKGSKKGVIIWSETKKAMEATASLYTRYKEVIILGAYKNGSPFTEEAVS
jgi:hypothetical protein